MSTKTTPVCMYVALILWSYDLDAHGDWSWVSHPCVGFPWLIFEYLFLLSIQTNNKQCKKSNVTMLEKYTIKVHSDF